MKRIGLVLFFTGYWLLATGFYTCVHAQQETLEILTYYPAPYGVYQTVKVYNNNQNATQTNFTQSLTSAGLIIETDYTPNAYTPGIFWSTENNNNTRPKAGIYLKETAAGTNMYFGTSNSYTTGITNDALLINPDGRIGIGTTDPTSDLSFGGEGRRMIGMERRTATGTAGSMLVITAGGASSEGSNLDGGDLLLRGGISTGTGDSNIYFMTATPGTSGSSNNLQTTKMFIQGDGKVGIGTTNPAYPLHVVGSTTLGSILIAPDQAASASDSELLLAEDNDYTYGMSIKYDGGDNELKIYGKNAATTSVPHLTIGRDNGFVTIDKRLDIAYNASDATNNGIFLPKTDVLAWRISRIADNATLNFFYGSNSVISFGTTGNIYKEGTCSFCIQHPLASNKRLIHTSLEGPEIAVYYRGEDQLTEGKTSVKLPDYFEALTRKEGRTVQITCKDGWSPLYAEGEIKDGEFIVKKQEGGNPNQKFYWEVKAVRKDVPALIVERTVDSEEEEAIDTM